MINTFHKDYPGRLIATLLAIDSTLSMVKLITKLFIDISKRKRG